MEHNQRVINGRGYWLETLAKKQQKNPNDIQISKRESHSHWANVLDSWYAA